MAGTSNDESAPPPSQKKKPRAIMFRGRLVESPNSSFRLAQEEVTSAGAAGGIEHHELIDSPASSRSVRVTCTDYSAEHHQVHEIESLDEFLEQHRPSWSHVRWINVDGLTDLRVIRSLAEKYHLHPLAVEDVLHVPQRPKVEGYGGADHSPRLFLVARMMELIDGRLHTEQVSFFLGRNTLLTFQETAGDMWDPIRQRIANPAARLRANDASFLMYALLDAVVDQCFPILEFYSDKLEDLEETVLAAAEPATFQRVHAVKRELLLLRRAAWPMREVINCLHREPHECMSDETRTYLRDVYDHSVQIIDLIETYREFAAGLTETYMSALSIRMNEVMKLLTVMGTIFIPLTFLAGVYGMNMPIPENQSPWAYPVFWVVCLVTVASMLMYFRRRKWL